MLSSLVIIVLVRHKSMFFRSRFFLQFVLTFVLFTCGCRADSYLKQHRVNFKEVKIKEFIRFVSKVCEKNFIFKDDEFDFNISFISGKSTTSTSLLEALRHILYQHHFKIVEYKDYYLIEKINKKDMATKMDDLNGLTQDLFTHTKLGSIADQATDTSQKFHFCKLQYHVGSELLKVIKQVAATKSGYTKKQFDQAVESMQWIESTNSLVFNSDDRTAEDVKMLITSLDKAQKQVFIEVLVVETDVKDGLEFGLEWAGKGNIENKLAFGFNNSHENNSLLSQILKNKGANESLKGHSVPLGKGFDLGVIGDLIFHKGKTFSTLSSLVSALQRDGKATIVLTQKILTQDNKTSKVFVGDNIPFTGSVIETVGAAQQTTSNIEYRDIGVSLNITPLLGDSDVITLNIEEDITEAREDLRSLETRQAHGIITSKTNMVTRAHVPDQNFLVLSGMVKNSKMTRKSGIPCLGGLPYIGAAFSKTKTDTEKKNIIVFVRPQIIHNFNTYQTISNTERKAFEKNLDPREFQFETKELPHDSNN